MENEFNQFDQYDTEKKSRLPFKKRWLFLGVFTIIIIVSIIILIRVMPRKDRISTNNLPASYLIKDENNYIAFQSRGDCSGYATAFTIRHFGIDAEGPKVYDESSQFFGAVALHNIVKTLDQYGLKGKKYYGSIDTLKAELNKGNPVIALVKNYAKYDNVLHYVAVVGYDEKYIYIVDSANPLTNITNNKYYDRRELYDNFEKVWKTNCYPFVSHCYIVVEKK
jgi:hypothetical protein